MIEFVPDLLTSTLCLFFSASFTFLFVEAIRSRNENQFFLSQRNCKMPKR